MEYVKHNYSLRVYQVIRDHGPKGAPHLYSPSESSGRYVREDTLKRFFSPCKDPMDGNPTCSITQEIKWERDQIIKDNGSQKSLMAPQQKRDKKMNKPITHKKVLPEATEYTLKDICSELGTTPAIARKLLRSKGRSAPEGGWRWPNAEAAQDIKKFLKKLL